MKHLSQGCHLRGRWKSFFIFYLSFCSSPLSCNHKHYIAILLCFIIFYEHIFLKSYVLKFYTEDKYVFFFFSYLAFFETFVLEYS